MSDKLNENSVNETEEMLENTAKETAAANDGELEINASSPKLEENDNWEFEATAHTLDDTFIENDELVIEIPKKEVSNETRERPKAEPKKEEPREPKAQRDNRNTTIFLLVAIFGVIIIGALVFLGIRYYTVPATIGASETHEVTNPGNVTMDLGGVKVTAGMYSYYYNQILSSYASQAQQGAYDLDVTKDLKKQKIEDADGKQITWDKKIADETEEWLKQLAAYYAKGTEDGITLTAENKETIDSEIETVKKSAEQAGISVDDYVKTTYGDYVTLATLRKSSEWYIVAQEYSRKMATELRPTVEEANKYYESHKDDFLQIKFSWLPMIFNEDNKAKVEKQAKKYAKEIKNSDDLKKMIPKACKGLIDEYVESGQFGDADAVAEQIAQSTEASLTKSNPNQYPQDMVDFLFDTNNKVGTCTTITDDQYDAVYIVLKESEAAPVDDKTYSVRHILITPFKYNKDGEEEEVEDTEKYTDEEWANADKKAKKVYDEFLNTDKSEYQFSLLAEKYSKDPGSVSSGGQGAYGGLYYKQSLGTMVEEFENWSTDEKRKYGDTEIVKTKYGYHIMYFVDLQPDYIMDCITAVSVEKEEEFINSYKCRKNKGIIEKVKEADIAKLRKDLKANSSAQSAVDGESANLVTPEEEEAEEAADAEAAAEEANDTEE